jgi:hypothetical protein
MSLKDLFQVKKVLPPVSNEQIAEEIESVQLIDSYSKDKTRVEFAVNYSTASNFAIFGSAEKYYTDTIQRIYSQYPYDGSKKEKLDWYNSSSLLDIWFLENAYPKTTGYATFSPSGWGLSSSVMVSGYGNPASKEYIVIKGGPNTSTATTLKEKFNDVSNQQQKSNVYDTSANRLSNLQTNLNNGLTLEFWLNKSSFITSSTQKEVIFDLWNNEASSSSGYGRLTLELSGTTGSPFYITAQSGTNGAFRQNIGSTPTTSSLNGWNHYAVSLYNTSSAIQAKFYLNGELDSTHSFATSINEITGSLIANIGALRTAPSGTTGISLGWGKLSASIDDFRFWKEARTSREIGRNYWDSVGGGVNTDDANTTLGFYYKFNEGITTTSSIDSTVLDYSGRVSNGTWVGYTASSRNTGSAITNEAPDPIIYITHPDVVDVIEEYTMLGTDYDRNNSNTIYYSFPNWIIEEDSNKELLNLTQIAASYLDTLYLQIKFFTTIKDRYTNIQIDEKPFPFSKTILESMGIAAPSLFIDAKLVEEVLSRDDQRNYEDKLDEIKNVIYQNIYSNLTDILKSKGTEKSYRNILRCFGIDENLVRLNVYSNNGYNKVANNLIETTTKKKSINLNDVDRFESTIYQYKFSTNLNSYSYVSSSSDYDYVPLTYEAEVVFPKKLDTRHPNYFVTSFVTSSIFGVHGAVSDPDDLTWNTNDYFNFQVYSVRNQLEGDDVKFFLSSSNSAIPLLTSSLFNDVYNNEKWNFAVSITPNKIENVSLVSGSTNTTYTLEFYGVNTDGNIVKNEFSLTSSLSSVNAQNIVRQSRRTYFGAERTNFTGSLIKQTDIKLLGLRYWISNLSHEDIQTHAFIPNNYGISSSYENQFLPLFSNVNIPKFETLLLDWNFSTVTGSDGGVLPNARDGKFVVEDATSGSLLYNTYNTQVNNLKKYQFTGRGDFFLQNDNTIIDTQYLFSSKMLEFETITNSNLINILTTEEQETFTRETRPINYYFSFEKSMYQTISDEMLKMFGTILDFNNLVGDPVNKYRKSYKGLDQLRSLFFQKVQNEPDLDKYLDFYKWIDSAVGKFLLQLTPASADTSEGLLNVVESHALERNKHQHKFPTIEFKLPVLETGAQSINKHLYNWRLGHHPISNREDDNCFYWNERAERDVAPISSSNSGVNETRKQILNVSLQVLNRSFTTPYRFKLDESKPIQGGVNFDNNKNLEFATIALAPHGPMDADSVINVPANYLFAGIPNTSSLLQDCNDVLDPNKKVKYHFTTVHGRDYLSSSLSYGEVLSSKIALPANFISGTVNTGYQSQVASEFMNGVVITNIHNDTYGSRNEVAIQGPFTNQWVGGRQSRHVPLNQGTDTYTNRPEAWKILMGTGSFSGSYQTAIGFVGADYPYPEGNEDEPSYPVRAHLRATYLREETAKRSVNIKNIRSSTGSLDLGNYDRNYQVVHSVGSTINNRALLDAVNPTNNTELYGIVRTDITDGRVDYQLPTRQRSETIIINRFSAPGDYRTMSRGYLNNYAEELSPYNSLPFRNRRVIGDGRNPTERLIYEFLDEGGLLPITIFGVSYYEQDQLKDVIEIISGSNLTLTQLNTLPSEKGKLYYGVYPTEAATTSSIASIHKTNRNRIVVFTNQTKNINDNGFITHQIPQKDSGYAWITASLSQSGNIKDADFGYLDNIYKNGTLVTYPSGNSSTSRTLEIVSSSDYGSVFDGTYRFVGPSTGTRTNLIPFDFVGLNTNIYESSSQTTIGTTEFSQLTGGLITDLSSSDPPYYFNGIMLRRNGPYGYPTFKQIRNSYNPIVRGLNKQNYISIFKNENFIIQKEPSVYFNKPVETTIKDVETSQLHYFTYSYENLKQSLENVELYDALDNKTKNDTFYNKKMKFLLNNDKYKLIDMTIRTSIFPRKSNKFLINTRKRNYYTFSAWRDLRQNRSRFNTISDFNYQNSGSVTILIPTQSIWPMDGPISTSYLSNSFGGEGVLQNAYSTVHNGVTGSITASVLYAHKQMIRTGYVAPTGLNIVGTSTRNVGTGLFDGTMPWQAGEQGTPYNDNYNEWFDKIRTISKDYSILPEYIISDDNKILATQDNRLDDVSLNSISLTGSSITSLTSLDANFNNDFVVTDSIFDIDKIKGDLASITNTIKLSLNCDAIIKFNPKPELYPQVQTVKIAEKFIETTKDYVSFWTGSSPESEFTQYNVAYRSLLAPMFAPGILYNTIKSGIAVDYPILTGTLSSSLVFFEGSGPLITNNYLISNQNFDKRLPFETLVEPENYLTTNIIDCEPHPSATLSVTASWTGNTSNNLYKLAINNFLAESINFFLPEGKLTTLFSKPENEFNTVDPTKVYRSLIQIYKSADNNKILSYASGSEFDRLSYIKPQYSNDAEETITMYSRPSAFGPAAGGTAKSSVNNNTAIHSAGGYYPAFTPPYYDGSSWALITYTPTGSVPYKPTLQNIIDNLSIKYIRYEFPSSSYVVGGPTAGTGISYGPYNSSSLNQNSMQVSASLNFLNIVNVEETNLNNVDATITNGSNKVWAIQTKFETPILNFNPSATGITVNTSSTNIPTYGMWHQYGVIPQGEAGVYLQITDIPPDYILKGVEGNVVYTSSLLNTVPQLTASLTDIVGFSKEPVKLGQVATSKRVTEGVVAIPYKVVNNERKFFKLNNDAVNYTNNQFFGINLQTQEQQLAANTNISTTIKNQISKMKNFVIPPKFDFIHNKNVDPIAMYIFEFSYNLTQEDLSKIWQGIQPDISVEFEKQNMVIEHELSANEFMNVDDLTEKVEWLVFKVKQKAKTNYYERLLTSTQEKDRNKIKNLLKLGRNLNNDLTSKEIDLNYSYNWPYDFFSIVELAKIEAKVQFSNPNEDIVYSLPNQTLKTLENYKSVPEKFNTEQIDIRQNVKPVTLQAPNALGLKKQIRDRS